MAKFRISCVKPITQEEVVFWYDNMSSLIFNHEGKIIEFLPTVAQTFQSAPVTSKETPLSKDRNIKILKIQLGLACNYECTYCNQRFVPRSSETTKDHVELFLTQLPDWFDGGDQGDGTGVRVELWGGEPFVYWKTLKPLAEGLVKMYPNIELTMITNGTLLDLEKNAWLDHLNFGVGISHDGPGYHVRGADPLDDTEKKNMILDLWARLAPKNKISFNAMVNKNNQSRAAIQQYFRDKLGFSVPIGEGGFVDPYDEGGASVCFNSQHDHMTYRNKSFAEIRAGQGKDLSVVTTKLNNFIGSVLNKRPASAVGQKCGMDNPQNIAVDLNGNVLTCQNVSAVAKSFNGENHRIGHVSDFNNIKLKTSTHWSHRTECPDCPVLQICQGSCMFLHGDMWKLACDNAYSDNIPFFLAAWEILTGCIPYYIEGALPEDRKDVLGSVNVVPDRPV
jgi:uncharacterized protein